MIAVGSRSVPTYVRLVWGGVLSAKEQVYVESARVTGCSAARIMFRHVLPNVVAPTIVVASLGIGTAILSAAGSVFSAWEPSRQRRNGARPWPMA